MWKQKGIALILVLTILAILTILMVGVFLQSNVGIRIAQYQKELALAQTAAETARGWAQMQTQLGYLLPVTADTTSLGFTTYPLSWGSGAAVSFAASGSGGAQARAIPVSAPVYDASGNRIGTAQVGYFAFAMKAGPPTEVFAIGAFGAAPDQIMDVREIHVLLNPVSYSQYSTFVGNPTPANGVTIDDKTPNRITNKPLSDICLPPCGVLFNPGETFSRSASIAHSFNKVYIAGPLSVSLSANNHLTGLDGETEFHIAGSSVRVLSTGRPFYAEGGMAGLYMNSTNIGLPDQTGLNNVMTTLFNLSADGLKIYDPNDSNLPSSQWTPAADWDPEAPTSVEKAVITLNSAGQRCSDGSRGTIKVANNIATDIAYQVNGGSPQTIPTGDSHCFTGASLNNPLVYVHGNMSISADSIDGYSGKTSYVATGRIKVAGDLASHSFLNMNRGHFPPEPGYTFRSSAGDLSALMTPYKILISPPSAAQRDFRNSMVLMQIGEPSTLPDSWNVSWANALGRDKDFTIKVDETVYPSPCSPSCPYNNIILGGPQISFTRSGNWHRYYSTVSEPFDINNLQGSPPYNPNLSAGFYDTGWREVNRATGQDMKYATP